MKKCMMFMFFLVFAVSLVCCGGKKNGMRQPSEPLLGTADPSQSTEVGSDGTEANAIISTPGSPSHATTIAKTFDFSLQIIAINGTIYTFKTKNAAGIEKEFDVKLVPNESFSENSIIDKPVMFKNYGMTIDISVEGVSGSVVVFPTVPSKVIEFSINDNNKLSYQFK